MATLVDTSIPEITRQFSEPGPTEFIEPDVVVKSKPLPPSMALLQEQGRAERERDSREEGEDEWGGGIEPDVVVKSKPKPVALLDDWQEEERDRERDQEPAAVLEVTSTEITSRAHGVNQIAQTSSPPSSLADGQSSGTNQKRANGDVSRGAGKVAPSQAVAEDIEQVGVKKTDSDFEDSTAMLLRRYTASKNGRQTNIPITSTGEIGGTVSMKDTFRVAGKSCTVRLEEDYISWTQTGKKDAPEQQLYLSDVFAVIQGHRPPSALHTRSGTPQSSSSSRHRSQLANPARGPAPPEFTLHALRSIPGSVGRLVKVVFRGQSSDTCQTWVEQISHQMQNFGNRPRKLYVIINLASGDGPNSVNRTWQKVMRMFQLANIHTDVLQTQHRFHAREQIQSIDLSQYDGVITVGGDGLFNEVINGLLLTTQQQSGVNMRRPQFAPVTPNIRIGVIPTGRNNSIARSVFQCKCPITAAAQIMLGCSSPMDICSVSHNDQFILFSAGPLSYGFWSDTAFFSQEFSWLGSRAFDLAMLRTLLSHKHFEAEIQYIPVEDSEDVVKKRERCFNRCPLCSNFESVDSPSAANEKGASVMAGIAEVSRVDDRQWKTVSGEFTSIVSCPNVCYTAQAPRGMSPYGHLGNGCTDLIFLQRCSTMSHAKWLMKQRWGNSQAQLDHPHLHIQRVREFRFREILKPAVDRGSRASSTGQDREDLSSSVDNLVQDDDEATNRRAAAAQSRPEGSGVALPTSRWNVDGDELPKADIDVRVHRHLLSVFARGPEPTEPDSASSSQTSVGLDRTDQDELLPSSRES